MRPLWHAPAWHSCAGQPCQEWAHVIPQSCWQRQPKLEHSPGGQYNKCERTDFPGRCFELGHCSSHSQSAAQREGSWKTQKRTLGRQHAKPNLHQATKHPEQQRIQTPSCWL